MRPVIARPTEKAGSSAPVDVDGASRFVAPRSPRQNQETSRRECPRSVARPVSRLRSGVGVQRQYRRLVKPRKMTTVQVGAVGVRPKEHPRTLGLPRLAPPPCGDRGASSVAEPPGPLAPGSSPPGADESSQPPSGVASADGSSPGSSNPNRGTGASVAGSTSKPLVWSSATDCTHTESMSYQSDPPVAVAVGVNRSPSTSPDQSA